MYLWYLGGFSTNYIIFKNADIFRKYISHQGNLFVKENKESFEIFWNTFFLFKTESSKLINYSADMCQSSLLGLWVCNPSLTLSIDIYSALSTKSDAFYFPSNRKSANKRIEFTNQ